MGYQVPRVVIDIDLAGTPYAGAQVKASSMSFGRLLALGDQPDRLRAGAGLSQVKELVELFVARVSSWNLEDDLGAPVPVTLEHFLDLDFPFATQLILSWLKGMTDIDVELGKGSTSGQPSAPPNFPMEAL